MENPYQMQPGPCRTPTWVCDCCGRAPVWQRKRIGPDGCVWPAGSIYDRGPHQVTFGDKTYQACSVECVRNIYVVRGLEAAFSKIADTLKEKPHA